MIHQLPLNACPSQKKSEHQDASMAGLRNASRNSCGFAAQSERIWRGQELLYIWEKQLFDTTEGTPQGGPLSPTLCNRVLDGLENTIQAVVPKRQVVHFVRYADDFIVAAESKELLESVVRPAIEAFLAERGLRLSPEKTKLTRIDEGFDFLGKNVRKFKDKLIITPARKNVRAICAKIRETVRKCRGHSPAELIRRLNPIIRGWANSHNTVQASKAFDVVDRVLFDAVWRWCLRSHPKKNKGWIIRRYYQRRGRKGWRRFGVTERDKKGKLVRLELAKPRDVPLVRYIKIRARSNPHDAKDRDYFIMRRKANNYTELPSAARKGKSTQSPKPRTTNKAGSAPPRAS